MTSRGTRLLARGCPPSLVAILAPLAIGSCQCHGSLAESYGSISWSPAALHLTAPAGGLATGTVTLVDSGAQTVHVSSIAVTSDTRAVFSVTQSAIDVGSGTPATVIVTYAPQSCPPPSAGADTAELSFASDAANAPTFEVSLVGVCEEADAGVSSGGASSSGGSAGGSSGTNGGTTTGGGSSTSSSGSSGGQQLGDAGLPPDAGIDAGLGDAGSVSACYAGGTCPTGQTLVGGQCQGLATLAQGQPDPQGIAVSNCTVFWANVGAVGNDGAIMSVPVGGGMPLTLSSVAGGGGIAVGAAGVYWATGSALMSVPIGGGMASTLAANPDALWNDGVGSIAVDPTGVYWTDFYGGTMLKVGLDGGSPVTLAAGQDYPTGVAIDATSVYWTDTGGGLAGSGTVTKALLDGGEPQVLASGLDFGPNRIAVNSTSVCWASSSTVNCVPIGGGATTAIALGQNGVGGLALDETRVYWVSPDDGTVLTALLDAGTPLVLASGQAAPQDIAVDATSVYWTNGGTKDGGFADGVIMMLSPK